MRHAALIQLVLSEGNDRNGQSLASVSYYAWKHSDTALA
jgi:hypothetical protein